MSGDKDLITLKNSKILLNSRFAKYIGLKIGALIEEMKYTKSNKKKI
jgi:hypothetical protein|tara:strand:- start:149 stop:289 length:141 start_codon:yes stop_codon:yes gene_type:complete